MDDDSSSVCPLGANQVTNLGIFRRQPALLLPLRGGEEDL